jgi:hypothetical protein
LALARAVRFLARQVVVVVLVVLLLVQQQIIILQKVFRTRSQLEQKARVRQLALGVTLVRLHGLVKYIRQVAAVVARVTELGKTVLVVAVQVVAVLAIVSEVLGKQV